MEDHDQAHRLGAALNHLHAFAARFAAADYVDEASALTASDLDVILATLETVHAASLTAPKR